MVRDLSDKTQVQRQLASRTRRAQAATRQQDMAVDRGAFRVKSEEGLEVGTAEDPTGSQVVYGVLRIIGKLVGDGDINWEGVLNQIGATNLRGPVAITGENGTLTVDAETLLQGLVTLLENLIVRAPGKITVEGGDSPATIENGKMSFGTGGAVEADTSIGGVKMTAGDAVVNAGSVASMRKGSSSIIVGPDDITINPAGSGDIDMLGTVRMPEPVHITGNAFIRNLVSAPSGAITASLVVDIATGRIYRG